MRRTLSTLAALALATAASPARAVPATVPVQGVLADADGAAIAAELPVVFTLYADPDGDAAVWLEERAVRFDQGFFSIDLGAVEPLDAGLFRDHPEGLWLGIAVDGDDEMAPIALGTAPFAGFAEYAGHATDADTLNGAPPEAFARAGHGHAFASLSDIPPGLADGDDDTTYAAADGLELRDGAFALRPCAAGQVLARDAAGWACADGGTLAPAVGAELVGTELIVTDGAAVSVVDLAALVADDDADPRNELLISAALDGSALVLSDAGGDTRVDLAALVPAGALTVSAIALDGTTLVLGRGADPADALLLDLAPLLAEDGDRDPSNELLQSASLAGTTLELRDAGGVLAVDFAPLLADGDADPANELLRGARLDGTVLALADAGGETRVDLAGLGADADADPNNELLVAAALDGTVLTLEDRGGPRMIELASLVDDADADSANELLLDAALVGTVLNLEDAGGQRAVELASLVDDADPDPTNELQSLVFSGRSGVLSITGNNAVNLYDEVFVVGSSLSGPAVAEPAGQIVDGDDAGQSVELPFTVRYGGVTYSHIWIESNGFVELQEEAANLGSDFFNTALPTANHSGPFVAAYWDDLVTTVRWRASGEAPARVFTVEWQGRTLFRSYPVDFTLQLHEASGVIAVRYRAMDPEANGQRATIGFQTAGDANAKVYPLGYNSAVIDTTDPDGQGWSVSPLR